MTDTTKVDDKSRKERSPSFPFIPLEKAIVRAQARPGAADRSGADMGIRSQEQWPYSDCGRNEGFWSYGRYWKGGRKKSPAN